MMVPIAETAAKATAFKALHIPSTPVLLANVYDDASARVVASLPGCRALASASYALALSIGKTDETLTLDDNVALVRPIAVVARDAGLPLTVDMQDGYAGPVEQDNHRHQLRAAFELIITELGAVGANLEDSWHEGAGGGKMTMMDEEEAVSRIAAVRQVAVDVGVPDFVLNARSDSLLAGGTLDESIRRGKRYLKAGATTVFIFWPRTVEMAAKDVQRVVDELGGMVNISCPLGKGLTTADLARMGAARVSVGPQLYLAAAAVREKTASDEAVAAVLKEKAEEVFGM